MLSLQLVTSAAFGPPTGGLLNCMLSGMAHRAVELRAMASSIARSTLGAWSARRLAAATTSDVGEPATLTGWIRRLAQPPKRNGHRLFRSIAEAAPGSYG